MYRALPPTIENNILSNVSDDNIISTPTIIRIGINFITAL